MTFSSDCFGPSKFNIWRPITSSLRESFHWFEPLKFFTETSLDLFSQVSAILLSLATCSRRNGSLAFSKLDAKSAFHSCRLVHGDFSFWPRPTVPSQKPASRGSFETYYSSLLSLNLDCGDSESRYYISATDSPEFLKGRNAEKLMRHPFRQGFVLWLGEPFNPLIFHTKSGRMTCKHYHPHGAC